MELTFYDRKGQPFCYTKDGEHLYTFGGQPIAYFHDDSVYAFSGRHLGWRRNGWIYDSAGHALLFSKKATGGSGKPGLASRPGRPGKGGRADRHGRPGFSGSWSTLSAEAFFAGT